MEFEATSTCISFFFWLRWVFVAALGLSPVVASGGYSLVVVYGLLLAVASLCCRAPALGRAGFGAVVHGLSCLVAYGIFLDQGSNPCPLPWQRNS